MRAARLPPVRGQFQKVNRGFEKTFTLSKLPVLTPLLNVTLLKVIPLPPPESSLERDAPSSAVYAPPKNVVLVSPVYAWEKLAEEVEVKVVAVVLGLR
jgi:hypothetical protein